MKYCGLGAKITQSTYFYSLTEEKEVCCLRKAHSLDQHCMYALVPYMEVLAAPIKSQIKCRMRGPCLTPKSAKWWPQWAKPYSFFCRSNLRDIEVRRNEEAESLLPVIPFLSIGNSNLSPKSGSREERGPFLGTKYGALPDLQRNDLMDDIQSFYSYSR